MCYYVLHTKTFILKSSTEWGVSMQERFYIVDKNSLPSVFEKVIEAKKLLFSGKCKTVNEAVDFVGISRSAFYKYKDSVSVYIDNTPDCILNVNLLISDRVGVLSRLLTLLSDFKVSILTINQSIPTDGIAPVSISMSTRSMTCSSDELLTSIKNTDGVLKVDFITKS